MIVLQEARWELRRAKATSISSSVGESASMGAVKTTRTLLTGAEAKGGEATRFKVCRRRAVVFGVFSSRRCRFPAASASAAIVSVSVDSVTGLFAPSTMRHRQLESVDEMATTPWGIAAVDCLTALAGRFFGFAFADARRLRVRRAGGLI